MKLSRRAAIAILVAALFILAGALFWPYILNNLIQPIALVAWLLLRIFILSIDQGVYWIGIILVALVFLYRFLSPGRPIPPVEESFEFNETINTIAYWRSRFTLTDGTIGDEKALKRELTHLLAALYASKSHTETNFGIYDALQRGEIPLPEHVHRFLFPEEPQKSGSLIKKILRSIRTTPRKWLRKWKGEEKAEHYQRIDEVLRFLETSLEIKNDQ